MFLHLLACFLKGLIQRHVLIIKLDKRRLADTFASTGDKPISKEKNRKSCFYKADLDGLQAIINLNADLYRMEPLEIGYQTWDGGRIITFALINNNITALPNK